MSVICFSTADHPLSVLLRGCQTRARHWVTTALEKLQASLESAEDSLRQMSNPQQNLSHSHENSGVGTRPRSAGSENITITDDREVGKPEDGNLASEPGPSVPSVSSPIDNIGDTSSQHTFSIESHVARDMVAEVHALLDQLEHDVQTTYDELRTASVSEDDGNMLGLILQGFFFTHLWDDILTFYRYMQESAAYATVSARQGRHLANTFEVAAIECLTSG